MEVHEERGEGGGVEVRPDVDGNEEANGDGEGDEGKTRPKKQRRGSEAVGQDCKCEIEVCRKDFKSVRHSLYLFLFVTNIFNPLWVWVQKNAMTIHHNVTHLGSRDHLCPGRLQQRLRL